MSTPLHRRPGVTVDQLKVKRSELLALLESPGHITRTVTRDYGTHDPRIAPFPPCTCDEPAKLVLLGSGKWHAHCTSCTRAITDPQKHDWTACLQWCAMNKDQLDYQTLPLFGLHGLDARSAKVRMTSIYDDLLLRSQVATLDLAISERTQYEHTAPGRDYLEKINAYRDWAKLVLGLIKQQSNDEVFGLSC